MKKLAEGRGVEGAVLGAHGGDGGIGETVAVGGAAEIFLDEIECGRGGEGAEGAEGGGLDAGVFLGGAAEKGAGVGFGVGMIVGPEVGDDGIADAGVGLGGGGGEGGDGLVGVDGLEGFGGFGADAVEGVGVERFLEAGDRILVFVILAQDFGGDDSTDGVISVGELGVEHGGGWGEVNLREQS